MKHTNFHNEIEGGYHTDGELGWGFYAAIIVGSLMILLLISEWSGLTDRFINSWSN